MEEHQQIILVPTPGMGHLIPLTVFAKQLIFHHNFSVTIFIPSDHLPSKAQITILNSLPNSITCIFLPPVNLNDLPKDAKVATRICHIIARSLTSLRDEITKQVKGNNVRCPALVVDLYGTDIFDVAMEFKIPAYIFFPGSAMGLSMFFEFPKLADSYVDEFKYLPEPFKMPGCVPLEGKDFLDPAQDRKNEAYKWLLHHAKRYNLAEGILVNSFIDLEPGALAALMEGNVGKPMVYPVGPVIQDDAANSIIDVDGVDCLRWLDHQPHESVLFVSFGSGGTLTHEQLTELALGLEMSEEKFLWVLRSPSTAANASFFDAQSVINPLGFLPNGFLQRTKDTGLVVPSWVPQIKVLSHGSIGGFVTHCGWNSTLESIVHGVPLIAWPLYAEQRANAVMLRYMEVALKLDRDENGLISCEEIAKIVVSLTRGEEGKQARNKMKELKIAAARALSDDGSSTKSLHKVTCKWRNK